MISVSGRNWLEKKVNVKIVEKIQQDHNLDLKKLGGLVYEPNHSIVHRNDQNDHRNDEKPQHPIIGRRSTSTGATVAKLDVNTVWVEMMLHNERNKMLAQSS